MTNASIKTTGIGRIAGAIVLSGAMVALAACGTNVEQRAATGAIAGAVVAGPAGAVVGGAAGTAVSKATDD